MTNPVPVQQGNPDWGRQIAYGSVKILQRSAATPSLTSVGPIYAGNLPFMYVSLSCIQAVELGIAWFMDAAGTQSLFGDVVTIDTNAADAKVCIPVRGPYVKFTFLHAGGNPTINLDVFSVPSRFNVYVGDGGHNLMINIQNQVINAGNNFQLFADTVRAGRAHWMAFLRTSTNYIAYLQCRDYLGTQTILDVTDQNSIGRPRYIFIPAMPINIQIFNLGAGNLESFGKVLIHPFDD